MAKRGQGLPVNLLIIFILALVVLGLLSYFIFREGGAFGKGIAKCESRAGTCIATTETCDGRVIEATCPKEKPTCCLPFGGGA